MKTTHARKTKLLSRKVSREMKSSIQPSTASSALSWGIIWTKPICQVYLFFIQILNIFCSHIIYNCWNVDTILIIMIIIYHGHQFQTIHCIVPYPDYHRNEDQHLRQNQNVISFDQIDLSIYSPPCCCQAPRWHRHPAIHSACLHLKYVAWQWWSELSAYGVWYISYMVRIRVRIQW